MESKGEGYQPSPVPPLNKLISASVNDLSPLVGRQYLIIIRINESVEGLNVTRWRAADLSVALSWLVPR
jgi:hypothetical protein